MLEKIFKFWLKTFDVFLGTRQEGRKAETRHLYSL